MVLWEVFGKDMVVPPGFMMSFIDICLLVFRASERSLDLRSSVKKANIASGSSSPRQGRLLDSCLTNPAPYIAAKTAVYVLHYLQMPSSYPFHNFNRISDDRVLMSLLSCPGPSLNCKSDNIARFSELHDTDKV